MADRGRRSSRLEKKRSHVFQMPSREERLAATGSSISPGGGARLSDISPLKKVSNLTRVTNRYNADSVDVYDSGSDVEDFINDGDSTSGSQSDNNSASSFETDSCEPPVKKRKRRRFSRIQKPSSGSDSEQEVSVQTSSVKQDGGNNEKLATCVANLSCSDDTQAMVVKTATNRCDDADDSALDLGTSPDKYPQCLSSSGISAGHSPTQALSSDIDDEDANCSTHHKVGGALASGSETEYDDRPVSCKPGGVVVFRHTSCSNSSSENGDPYAFGGLNHYRRKSTTNSCGCIGSDSDNDEVMRALTPSVVSEMGREFEESDSDNAIECKDSHETKCEAKCEAKCETEKRSKDLDSDEDDVVVQKAKNTSLCINSESEDSDAVMRSGGRRSSGHVGQIGSSGSEDEKEVTPQRPRSKRASRLSAKKEKWKDGAFGALQEERKRRRKESE